MKINNNKFVDKICVIFYWTVNGFALLLACAFVLFIAYLAFSLVNNALGLSTVFWSVMKTMGITFLGIITFAGLYGVCAFLYSRGQEISEKNEKKEED